MAVKRAADGGGVVATTHGMTNSKVYYTYRAMLSRCLSENDSNYHNYGGRGISVCDRWRSDRGFEAFYEDMGDPPSPKHTLEREDVNGNYDPSNCRWATMAEQARNKRNTVRIEYGGVTRTLQEWADELQVRYKALHHRLSRGWSIERMLTQPFRPTPVRQ